MSYIYWAGDETQHESVSKIRASITDAVAAGRFSTMPKADDFEPIWQKIGSTALIDIKGDLVNGSAGWGRLFGLLGYSDIAQAIIAAASDPEVKNLMFHFDTPGGEVAGVEDLGNLIKKVSGMKPSAAHASDKVGSAGVWLMSAVKGAKTAGPTATVGSIGVLQIAKEYSKQLADAGVTVKVLRSVDMKARMNPYEPLSANAEEHALAQLGQLHEMFVTALKEGRPAMSDKQIEKATDGRTFIGKHAVQMGLIDKVVNLDQALKLLDKNSGKKDNSSNSKGAAMKIILNDQQIAAIAGGATFASLGFSDEAVAAHNAAMAADQDGETEAQKTARLAAEAETARVAAAAEAARVAAANAGQPDAMATMLAKVETQAGEIARIGAELTTAKAEASAMKATHDGLLAIAREGITKMMVAMGGNATQAAAMDANTVINEFAKTKASFEAAFPIGGKANNAADTSRAAAAEQIPPQFEQLARAAAARK